jgi:hypothetical protein
VMRLVRAKVLKNATRAACSFFDIMARPSTVQVIG